MITNNWQKPIDSNPSGNCLEAKIEDGTVRVRDTKLGEASPELIYSVVDWLRFIQEIKEGYASPVGGKIETWVHHDGTTLLHRSDTTTRLNFTRDEWRAFLASAERGQFDLVPA